MSDDVQLQRALFASYQSARQSTSFGRASGGGSLISHYPASSFRSRDTGPQILRSSTYGRRSTLQRSGINPAPRNTAVVPKGKDGSGQLERNDRRQQGAVSRSAGSKDNKGSPSRAIARSKSTDTPGKSAQDHPSPSPGDSAVVRSLPGLDGKLLDAIEQDIVDPSASRVSFDDIASLDDAKRVLKEAVTLPLLLPDLFTGIREPWRGVLLFGPPGTGKTMLARAVAGGSATFLNCAPSTVASKYRGDSEKLVRTLFDVARARAPSVIFFDEVDALVSPRGADGEHEASRRFKAELLQQMDGIASAGDGEERPRVVVLAATNHPWDLDDALKRRLEKRVLVPLPDKEARAKIFELHLSGVPRDEDVGISELAERSDGFSGSDIRTVCRDAAMMPVRRLMEGRSPEDLVRLKQEGQLGTAPVTRKDLMDALGRARPTVSVKESQRFDEWAREFASG